MPWKTHQGSLTGCSRILYADVRLVLRPRAVSFNNFCKKLCTWKVKCDQCGIDS
ncbi:hypothetical protein C0J52_12770 [Blattella germanica]|nr:hypothetical protein C0J52_12770 [Blattella germanica]